MWWAVYGTLRYEIMIDITNGDCLDVMRDIGTDSVDMILSDPPYGTTCCKWDSVIPIDLMWDQLNRVIRPSGVIVLTAVQPFASALIMGNLEKYRYEWIWEKGNATGFFNANKMPLRAHENILVFYEKLPTYNPQKTHGHKRKVTTRKEIGSEVYGKSVKKTDYDSTSRYPRSVQKISRDSQVSKLHPTQKPLRLMDYMIKTYTNKGDTVLDFAMGSGTTGVSCVKNERNFIGIELNNKYFEIAEKRIKQG